MMKLYWTPHSRSLRAVWLLEEAGRPYERVLVSREGDHSDAEFRAVNPMAKVPALRDGDACVAESAAICAYVAEAVPGANLAPLVGDVRRGRYLHYLFFASGCIEAAFTQKMTGLELPPSQAGWGDFARAMGFIEQAVQPGPWLLGEQFTAADVMFGCDLFYGINLLKIIEPGPGVADYVARCTARPAFQRALAIDAEAA
jgi:glutathione S-transferase